MAIEDPLLAASLGARGQHILLTYLVEEAILGEDRHRREGADAEREQRQRQVPEIVEDLLPPRQHRPIVRGEAAQREQVEKRAAGEQDDQENGEQEAGYRVPDDNDAGGPDVERRAVLDRLLDAERDRDHVG